MKKSLLSAATLLVVAVGYLAFASSHKSSAAVTDDVGVETTAPSDCCADKTGCEDGGATPGTEPSHSDSPGKITCPLTGEIICADDCPLDEASETPTATETAGCCGGCTTDAEPAGEPR